MASKSRKPKAKAPQTPALQARRQRTSPGIFFFSCHPCVLCGSGQQHPLRAPQRVQRIAFEIVRSGVCISS